MHGVYLAVVLLCSDEDDPTCASIVQKSMYVTLSLSKKVVQKGFKSTLFRPSCVLCLVSCALCLVPCGMCLEKLSSPQHQIVIATLSNTEYYKRYASNIQILNTLLTNRVRRGAGLSLVRSPSLALAKTLAVALTLPLSLTRYPTLPQPGSLRS